MDVKDWLGKDNELGIKIWKDKYQKNGESFEDWLLRVTNGDNKVMQLMLDKKFLFGGRILSSRGIQNERKVTFSNCYVLKPVGDSIEEIYETAGKLARTFSYGGGVGIDISNLRPKGAAVNNAALTTTGPVSFMSTFSQVSETIGQQGRRGALMISMDCNHPDIEEFINAKRNSDKINGANISVRVDEEFMQAVGDMSTEQNRLFRLLCKNNWDWAEPGILYWDTIKGYNLLSEYIKDGTFEFAGVNPCLVGDTLIQTIEGPKTIKELVGTQPYVYCMDDNGKLIIKQASKVWKTRENTKLVEIDFNRGKLICTPDHLIYTRNRGWVKAIELQPKDKLNGLGFSKGNEINEMIKLTSDNKYYKHHRFIMEQMGHDIKGKDVHHLDENHLNNVYSNLQVLTHSQHSKLTNIGHLCYCEQDINTGQFISKQEKQSRTKTDKVNYEAKGKNFIVKSVTVLNYTEDVYDMTIPDVHNFIANNIVVHNCAEEPLPAGGSCLLGAINLSAFVENRALNLPEFKQAVRIAIRALNDVLDEGLELHPLPEQRECVRKWRQIGLGIMGFADMLIKMGIQYGSERCLDIIDMIGNAMVVTGLDESANIAKERGAFEMFDAEKILNSTFIKNNHIPNKLIQKIEENGLRNSQLFTIAPTGSIGTMLEISTGVEPVFSPYYTRTTKSLEGGEKTFTVIHPSIKEVIGEDIENIPGYIVWAGIIDPLDRVETQARWQDYIDASISSTINLPQEATVEMVEEIYYTAWKKGLKGVTIFRDGCSRTAILNTNKEEEPKEEVHELGRGEWKILAEDTYYVKRDLTIGCGKLKLFIGYSPSEQAIQDLYIVKAGQGGCEKNLQAIAICMSAVLRLGGSLEQLKKAFSGISVCPSFTAAKGKGIILSPGNYCGMAILKEVEAFMKEKHIDVQVTKQEQPKADTKVKCPECGAALTMTGGCNVCSNCGYTKCD